jgi:hypothetical protein
MSKIRSGCFQVRIKAIDTRVYKVSRPPSHVQERECRLDSLKVEKWEGLVVLYISHEFAL